MTRLIDADILKEAINTWDKFACLPNGKLEPFRNLEHPEMFEPYIHFRDIIKAIDNAPTVDADLSEYSDKLWKEAYERGKNERPKGKWLRDNYGDTFCSHCGVECPYNEEGLYTLGHYCHQCGADMREADNDK